MHPSEIPNCLLSIQRVAYQSVSRMALPFGIPGLVFLPSGICSPARQFAPPFGREVASPSLAPNAPRASKEFPNVVRQFHEQDYAKGLCTCQVASTTPKNGFAWLEANQIVVAQGFRDVLAQVETRATCRFVRENARISARPAMNGTTGFSPNPLAEQLAAKPFDHADVSNQGVQMKPTTERPVLIRAKCIRLVHAKLQN